MTNLMRKTYILYKSRILYVYKKRRLLSCTWNCSSFYFRICFIISDLFLCCCANRKCSYVHSFHWNFSCSNLFFITVGLFYDPVMRDVDLYIYIFLFSSTEFNYSLCIVACVRKDSRTIFERRFHLCVLLRCFRLRRLYSNSRPLTLPLQEQTVFWIITKIIVCFAAKDCSSIQLLSVIHLL